MKKEKSMESKIIIIKIKNTVKDAISYLQNSYNNQCEYYYPVGSQDITAVSAHVGKSYIVAFVIFEERNKGEKQKVSYIYVGEGRVGDHDSHLVIFYSIKARLSSEMIITNFISNSELDLKNDFEACSYVNIEDNVELVNQISFIMYPPYKVLNIAANKQRYGIIDREKCLHKYSQKNEHCIRPIGLLGMQENRSEFQRDYERIVHTRAYRRLVDKAQIFTSSKGDHYRTRMTHTLEVAQIARAIAVGLNLNVELTEAIALAHDLGHTPFGHQGERTLDDILKGKIDIIKYTPNTEPNFYGGFKHNFQGVRVANCLEEKYLEFDGIDLSYQVLEGILKHTSTKIKDCLSCPKKKNCDAKCFDIKEFLKNGNEKYLYLQYPIATTLEGQIVNIADEIAQRSHDLDDSFSSGILNVEKLQSYLSLQKMQALQTPLNSIEERMRKLKEKHREFVDEEEARHSQIVSEVIKFFINDVIEFSKKHMDGFKENEFYKKTHRFNEPLIQFSADGQVLCNYLDKIISKKVINSPEVVRFDNKAQMVVKGLFEAYYSNPKLLHKGTLRKIYIEMRQITDEVIDFLEGDRDEVRKEIEKIINTDLSGMELQKQEEYKQKRKILVRAITDYIAGMTDSYAINEYNAIYQS